MKKHLQCGLTAALTLALLLTACGQKEADANDTPPDAQVGSLYEDFFTGDVTVTTNLINAGVEATTASFRAPGRLRHQGRRRLGHGLDDHPFRPARPGRRRRRRAGARHRLRRRGGIRHPHLLRWRGLRQPDRLPPLFVCRRPTAHSNGRTVPSTTAHPALALKMAYWSMRTSPPCPKAVMEILFIR